MTQNSEIEESKNLIMEFPEIGKVIIKSIRLESESPDSENIKKIIFDAIYDKSVATEEQVQTALLRAFNLE
jgi:hypothetical protein